MKLGPDVLLEIMSIVQKGLAGQTDVSQDLRDLDLLVSRNGEFVMLNNEKAEIPELQHAAAL